MSEENEQLRYEEEKYHYEMGLIADDFKTWWDNIGSAIVPLENHDHEEHSKRISEIAWKAAIEAVYER